MNNHLSGLASAANGLAMEAFKGAEKILFAETNPAGTCTIQKHTRDEGGLLKRARTVITSSLITRAPHHAIGMHLQRRWRLEPISIEVIDIHNVAINMTG
jgi:hypothetical protein